MSPSSVARGMPCSEVASEPPANVRSQPADSAYESAAPRGGAGTLAASDWVAHAVIVLPPLCMDLFPSGFSSVGGFLETRWLLPTSQQGPSGRIARLAWTGRMCAYIIGVCDEEHAQKWPLLAGGPHRLCWRPGHPA